MIQEISNRLLKQLENDVEQVCSQIKDPLKRLTMVLKLIREALKKLRLHVILLAGCEYFKRDMEKAVTKEKTGYPEFYSRVTNWHELNKPNKGEITAICQSNGVSDTEVIKEICRLPNYRMVYNAIINEKA